MSNLASLFASEPVHDESTGSEFSLQRYQSVDEVFEEIPVSLDVFIKDKKFLGEKYLRLSPIQTQAVKQVERIYYAETYPKLSQYDAYWAEPVRMTNYHAFQWGKCLDPDTLVYSAQTGQWVPLRDFKSSEVASAYAEDGVIGTYMATDSFQEGFGSMYRVRTKKGFEVTVYEGHKFLAWGREVYKSGARVRQFNQARGVAWRELRDMQIGDHVAVTSILPEPLNVVQQDSRVVELLGMWLGDGHMPKDRSSSGPSLTVGGQSPLTRQRYISLCQSFGCNIRENYKKGTLNSDIFTIVKDQRGGKGSNPVRELAFQWGLGDKTAADKRIPEPLFSLPTPQVALLVSRLIDTDGWITSKCNTCEIGYGTISKGLAEDIHKLLLRLGVLAELKEKKAIYDGRPYVSYQLRVRSKEMVERLASQLSLLDKEQSRLEVLSKVQRPSKRNLMHGDLVWDRIESIEYVGEGEYWTLTVDGPHSFVAGGAFLNHNSSGKDTVCRLSALRIAYLLNCLKSPQNYFQMAQDDSIHMLNVAISADQAQKAFFEPMTKMVSRGWFADKASPTKNAIDFSKNVQSISGHSKTDSQEGLNIILGVCDEIDGFKTKDELSRTHAVSVRESSNSAEAIMEMIQTSANSRFPETFKFVAISWPRYLGSTIQSLTDEYKKDMETKGAESVHYASGPLATWEVRTDRFRSQFNPQYEKDARTAAAKYECKPSFSINPYFRNEPAVRECMFKPDVPPVQVHYENDSRLWKPVYEFSDDFYPIVGAVYSMHADLAVKNDRAGIAMCHQARIESRDRQVYEEDGTLHIVTEYLPYIKTDFIIAYEADILSDPPREIQIQWALDLWRELKNRGFNIRQFSYDGYQCLSGNTEIPLLDGTTKTIEELTERSEPFWVYSMQDGKVVPGKCVRAWKTAYREDMLEVTLDNGSVINCTSDHLFMLRDGTYTPASELVPGSSLMPLYRKTETLGKSKPYEQVWHPEPGKNKKHWRFTHSVVAEKLHGPLPRGWVTHHVNLDNRNNTPENLLRLSNEEHSRLHAQLVEGKFAKLWADEEWAASHKVRLSALATARQTGQTGAQCRNYRHDISYETILDYCMSKIEQGVKLYRKDVQKDLGVSEDIVLNRVKSEGYASWKEFKWSLQPRSYSAIASARTKARKANKPLPEYARQPNNHKVVSVRPAPAQWVYDLEVEDYHNFALGAGVFVHNSTQSRQTLESLGVESPLISTDRSEEPWKGLRDLLYMGRISIPYDDILIGELLGLTKRENGKVDHQAGKSKDMADALACAAVGAITQGGQEDKGGTRAFYAPPDFVSINASPVNMMEDVTLENLAWGVDTHDPAVFNPDSWTF